MDETTFDDSAGRNDPERVSPLSKIDSRLIKLKKFETDLHNEETERARIAMRSILEPKLSWFDQRGVAITYHGSLQYNDPRTLDVDVAYASENPLDREEELSMEREIEHDFTQPGAWPRKDCATNFSWPSIDAIKSEVQARGNSAYEPEDIEQDADRWGSYILSSPVLFASQTELLGVYQQEVRKLAQESKWLRDGIVYCLESAIKVRTERRQGREV